MKNVPSTINTAETHKGLHFFEKNFYNIAVLLTNRSFNSIIL